MPNNGAYNNQAESPAERNVGPVGLTRAPVAAASGLIFEETFDNQPDWTSDDYISSGTLPENWTYGRYQSEWGPLNGNTDRHATAEILAANSDKARGGTGKSFVKWREGASGDGQNNFHSDAITTKYFSDQDRAEMYVEFYITFSSELIAAHYNDDMGSSKMFRILNHNGNPADAHDFFGEVNSPKFVWGISGGPTYGIRNFLSFYARGDNHTSLSPFGGLVNQGDWSGSYLTDLAGMRPDGSDAMLPNKKDGGFIDPANQSVAMLDEVFGPEGTWTKVAFYVKMNSAPGVQDGEVMQWIDGQRIVFSNQIDWIRSGWDMVGWNYASISGNDLIKAFTDSLRYEDWYAIDDLRIYDSIPEGVEH